jgi:hypothetical protein
VPATIRDSLKLHFDGDVNEQIAENFRLGNRDAGAASDVGHGGEMCACANKPAQTKPAQTKPAQTTDIYDARIFNWLFYVNTYADLLRAGISDEAKAKDHWKNFG